MPKFDASSVEELEYDFISPKDFRPRRDDGSVIEDAPGAWAGVVPEPSQDMVIAFLGALTDAALEASQAETEAVADLSRKLRQQWRDANPDITVNDGPGTTERPLTDDEVDQRIDGEEDVSAVRARFHVMLEARQAARAKQRDRLLETVAAFTQDKPGVDVLSQLPDRHIEGFTGWLAAQFSPEARAAAISR